MAVVAAVMAACSCGDDDATGGDDAGADGGIDAPPVGGVGAHALVYFRLESHGDTLATPAMSTQAAGSTIVVSVGRGDASAFTPPLDNQGNDAYPQLGGVHNYTMWPGSGTALYAQTDVVGGDGHVVRVGTPASDEVTMAVVEVLDATAVVDHQWNEVLAPGALRSLPVTTTGPATLIAFWWGDAGVDGEKTATPDSGFTRIEMLGVPGALVQCAAAVRHVDAAGTYDVTWTATPTQGAQLYLIAVQ